jgi:maleate isomerase
MRIGMLTPSSNTVLEPVTMRMVASMEAVSVHFSRLRVTGIAEGDATRRQFTPSVMVEAASLLADAKVDVIVWNGTSGGWEGLDADREIVAAVEAATSIPATTGTLATAEAFSTLGVERYALVVPYTEAITSAIKRTFATAGFECVAATNEGITVNWDFSQIPPELVAERARTVAKSRPQAIAIFCTNLCGAPVVRALETELGVPVVDSVIVCLWAAFHRLGRRPSLPGWGRLMAES